MTAPLRRRMGAPDRRTLAGLVGLLLVGAALRLPNLATRGTWDGDQGHDMLMLRMLVRDGVVPLLGPPTSIGDVHHGAFYYYLLSPAAFLTGGESPLAVVLLIALAGIAAIAVVWWLARSIGGDVAAFVAGLAIAVSPAAIDESTFIWNPNLIALSSAIALAGAWQAWRTRQPRWWLLAAVGTAVTMQCHVLGITLLPVVGALLVADVRRRKEKPERLAVARAGVAGLALIAVSFTPLVIHELTTNFGEVNAALAYLRAGGDAPSSGPLLRFVIVGLRVVSWPLVGLIADAYLPAVLGTAIVVAIVGWRVTSKSTGGSASAPTIPSDERTAVRWLGLGLLWSALALTFASPSLAEVVRGLPNDHYHAFADPMVFVLIGLGAGALWRGGVPARILGVVGVTALVLWSGTHLPAAVHADGGFPAAAAAAQRIESDADGATIELRSIPDFKSVEAYAYPLVRDGWRIEFGDEISEATLTSAAGASASRVLVVICDRLFEPVVGAPCGGPAEVAVEPVGAELSDRFDAAPGRVISVYGLAP